MALRNRKPLQVDPEFKEKLDELQIKIRRATGENKSLRELTHDIIRNPKFEEIEKALLKLGDIKMDIKIKLDKRDKE